MTPGKFVDNIKKSIDLLNGLYSQGKEGPTFLGSQLDNMGLSSRQRAEVLQLIELAVGEATHNIICGIEGSAALGESRQRYRLIDEDGHDLTGDLDSLLYRKLER